MMISTTGNYDDDDDDDDDDVGLSMAEAIRAQQ